MTISMYIGGEGKRGRAMRKNSKGDADRGKVVTVNTYLVIVHTLHRQ